MNTLLPGIALFMGESAIRVTVLLSLTAAAAMVSRRAPASARHLIWVTGLCGALASPLLTRLPVVLAVQVPQAISFPRAASPKRPSTPLPVFPAGTFGGDAAPTAPDTGNAPSFAAADSHPLTTASAGMRTAPPSALVPFTEHEVAVVPVAPIPAATSKRVPASTTRSATPDPWLLAIVGVWAGGATLSLGRLLFSSMAVRRIARACIPVDDPALLELLNEAQDALQVARPIALMRASCANAVSVPFTFGARRPVVVLPAASAGWATDQMRAALLHEVAHIRRGDWASHIATHIAYSAYWFHPLAWIAARRSRLESETACDDMVMSAGIAAQDYARYLLDAALSARVPVGSAAMAMAQKATIEARLTAILSLKRRRGEVSPGRRLGMIAAATGIVALGSVIRPVSQAASAAEKASAAHRQASRPAKAEDLRRWANALESGEKPKQREALQEIARAIGLDEDGDPAVPPPSGAVSISGARDLVPGLISALKTGDESSCALAATLLGSVGSPAADTAVPELLAAIGTRQGVGDFGIRQRLAAGMSGITGSLASTERVLEKEIAAAEPRRRQNAMLAVNSWVAFTGMASPDEDILRPRDVMMAAFPAIARVMAHDADPATRKVAFDVASKIASNVPESQWKPAAGDVADVLADSHRTPEDRIAAARILQKSTASLEDVRDTIAGATHDANEMVSANAAAALAYDPVRAAKSRGNAQGIRNVLEHGDPSQWQAAFSQIEMTYEVLPYQTNGKPPLAGEAQFVPGLIRVLHGTNFQTTKEAAALLSEIGMPGAQPAIPAIMSAMIANPQEREVSSGFDKTLLSSLTRLIGSPDRFGSALLPYLNDPSPEVRLNTVSILAYASACSDFHGFTAPPTGEQMAAGVRPVVRALARIALTGSPEMQSAAMKSLASLGQENWGTYEEAVWGRAIPNLAAILCDQTLALDRRRDAAMVLSGRTVGSLSSLPNIRQALRDPDPVIRAGAGNVFDTLMLTNPHPVIATLLRDLRSRDPQTRGTTAQECRIVANSLWLRRGFSVKADGVRMPGIPFQMKGVPYALSDRENLLGALGTACSDKDPSIRLAAASIIGDIARWEVERNGIPSLIGGKHDFDTARMLSIVQPPIRTAEAQSVGLYGLAALLKRAQTSIAQDDPALAKRLGDFVPALTDKRMIQWVRSDGAEQAKSGAN